MATTTTLSHEQLVQDTENVTLPDSDGVPLEDSWHRKNINLLCESLEFHWRHRRDFYVAGNMCVYYSVQQARNRDFLGPDVFVVQGVNHDPPRKVWATWLEENRGLDVAVELLSPSTANYDLTDKRDIYEQKLRTPEYFCYDPESKTIFGWRLDARRHYQRIEPAADGRLWSEELELWLGVWEGQYDAVHDTWLSWFAANGNRCLFSAEAEALRADAEAQRANAEAQRANAEAQRADAEAQRAARAEAELERFKAMLASQSVTPRP